MELLSCGKNTHLHSFPELIKQTTYENDKDDKIDFSFFHNNKFIVECFKNRGLLFLQTKKNDEGKHVFEKLKKISIDNISCVSAPKKEFQDFAIGSHSGDIKLLHYKTNKISKKFSPHQPNNAVNYLDFSSCDESLVSVYENGNVSIFGLTTFVKCDNITIENATMAKFHPTKRFQLSIASSTGGVSMYDSSSKKMVFQAKNAHTAPCRDHLIPDECPDRLMTVGYDKIINIFDTRKKTAQIKITSHCPISTITATSCGTWFCVGNLKGDLIAYDLRNQRTPLKTVRAHNEAINRVAFLPKVAGSDESIIRKSVLMESSVDQDKNEMSFSNASMLDMVLNHNRRQSDVFEKDTTTSRASTGSRLSTTTNDTRMSGNFGTKKIAGMFNDFFNPDISSNSSSNDLHSDDLVDNFTTALSNVTVDRSYNRLSYPVSKSAKSGTRNLTDINEENVSIINLDTPDNKENKAKNFQNESIPISVSLEQVSKDISLANVEVASSCNCASNNQNTELILDSLRSLHQKIDENNKAISLMAHDLETQKFTQNRFIWNMTEKILDRVKVCDQALAMLVNDEPVVRAGLQIQEENQLLVDRLNEITKKYGPFESV